MPNSDSALSAVRSKPNLSLCFQMFLKQFGLNVICWPLMSAEASRQICHVTKSCCSPHIFIAIFHNAACRWSQLCRISTTVLSNYVVTMERFHCGRILVASLHRLNTATVCLMTRVVSSFCQWKIEPQLTIFSFSFWFCNRFHADGLNVSHAQMHNIVVLSLHW